jgi:hypothetical protein
VDLDREFFARKDVLNEERKLVQCWMLEPNLADPFAGGVTETGWNERPPPRLLNMTANKLGTAAPAD